MTGLYVHIPFCARKCAYCDFYSLSGFQDLIPDYIDTLLNEASSYKGLSFETVFYGGGTPSILGAQNFSRLHKGLGEIFDFRHTEATVEVNPDSATSEFLESVKNLGINRISIGIQSLNDNELRNVGRIHDSHQAIESIKLTQTIGFDKLSCDVIIGLPGQSLGSLENTLSKLIDLDINHISAYGLQLEEHTPLGKNPPSNLPDDDRQADLFWKARDLLVTRGLVHYEISNFARPGHECMHNINYWRCGEYLGLGTGASSHLDGVRFKNIPDLKRYIENPAACKIVEEHLIGEDKECERAMLALRLLEEGYACPVNFPKLSDTLENLVQSGDLDFNGTTYRIHPSKVFVSNSIFAKVLGL